MFVLAHLSDIHLALRPPPYQLAGKRGLGYINWHRSRKYIHRRDTLDGAANIRYLAGDSSTANSSKGSQVQQGKRS
jgi:hypothetical protein